MTDSKNESQAPAIKEQPKVFTFNPSNAPVRVQVINQEPWFVAKDVCDALSIDNNRNATARLDDDEKGTSIVWTPSGAQSMTMVSESGLYNLIFQSRKAEAKVFRKWVTSEVLPQIRRTGAYLYLPGQSVEHPEERYFCKATIWRHKRFGLPQLMAPRMGEWTDLRDVPFKTEPLFEYRVRYVQHEDVQWFSINDILKAIKCSTSSCDVAHTLNERRQLAKRIFIFGNTHPAWFCTRTGMELILCTKDQKGGAR